MSELSEPLRIWSGVPHDIPPPAPDCTIYLDGMPAVGKTSVRRFLEMELGWMDVATHFFVGEPVDMECTERTPFLQQHNDAALRRTKFFEELSAHQVKVLIVENSPSYISQVFKSKAKFDDTDLQILQKMLHEESERFQSFLENGKVFRFLLGCEQDVNIERMLDKDEEKKDVRRLYHMWIKGHEEFRKRAEDAQRDKAFNAAKHMYQEIDTTTRSTVEVGNIIMNTLRNMAPEHFQTKQNQQTNTELLPLWSARPYVQEPMQPKCVIYLDGFPGVGKSAVWTWLSKKLIKWGIQAGYLGSVCENEPPGIEEWGKDAPVLQREYVRALQRDQRRTVFRCYCSPKVVVVENSRAYFSRVFTPEDEKPKSEEQLTEEQDLKRLKAEVLIQAERSEDEDFQNFLESECKTVFRFLLTCQKEALMSRLASSGRAQVEIDNIRKLYSSWKAAQDDFEDEMRRSPEVRLGSSAYVSVRKGEKRLKKGKTCVYKQIDTTGRSATKVAKMILEALTNSDERMFKACSESHTGVMHV